VPESREILSQEKAALLREEPLCQCVYLGGGVVVVELFLLFFPPLWLFLVLVVLDVVVAVVAFLPGGSGCGFNELLSPPVCAMTRPAPRSSVITNVEIFFMRFSDSDFYQDLIAGPIPENLHRLAGTFCRLLTRAARDSFFRCRLDAASSLKSGLMAAGFTLLFQQEKAACTAAFPGLHPPLFRGRSGGAAGVLLALLAALVAFLPGLGLGGLIAGGGGLVAAGGASAGGTAGLSKRQGGAQHKRKRNRE
jgi:hypothetical protein